MRYKNLYEITFQIKRNGWRKYVIHLEAYSMKEAKETAKKLWYENYKPHMFSIEIRKVPLDEVIDMKHWFVNIY